MEPLDMTRVDMTRAWQQVGSIDHSIKSNKVAIATALKSIERLEKQVGALGQSAFYKLYDKVSGNKGVALKEASIVYAKPLPDDVLRIIFTKVPTRALLQVRKVCKQWSHICNEKEFKAYAYLLTRFPDIKVFPSDWKSAVEVTNRIRPLNDSMEALKGDISKVNRKQNILFVVNGVTIAVSIYVLAPYIKSGFQKWGQYLEECERKAIQEIMDVTGLSFEEAKKIYLERLAEELARYRYDGCE